VKDLGLIFKDSWLPCGESTWLAARCPPSSSITQLDRGRKYDKARVKI